MFCRLPDLADAASVTITVDNEAIAARSTDTVAAALLAAGHAACRETAVSNTPRGPYCLMGVCFDCLVSIDGIGNRQGCLVRVREGMQVETQHGKRVAGR